MESKKLNIFTLFLVVVMCLFSIYTSTTKNKGENGINGINGTDGKDMTIMSVYNDYKAAYPNYSGSFDEFVSDYIGNKLSIDDEISQTKIAAQLALCSTVDICYSYYMDSYYTTTNSLYINKTNDLLYKLTPAQQPLMNVAAGSGVIYQMDTTGPIKTAYIITNFHVAYVNGYSNSENYSIVYNESTKEYLSLKSDKIINETSLWGITKYFYKDDIEQYSAPIETHFLDSYSIYLNGYQYKDYAISASFVGGSAEYDIAVLKVEYDSQNNPNSNNKLLFNGNYIEAQIKDSDTVEKHDYVIPVGNPLIPNSSDINTENISTYMEYISAVENAYINSLCLTTTGGRVSESSYYCDFGSLLDSSKTTKMRLIQVDAAINPGNSGGGLYNEKGQLVGIVNGKVVDTNYDNVGFAIPINIATRIANQIINNCDGTNIISISILKVADIDLKLKEVAGENKPTYNNLKWDYKYDITIESNPMATSILYNKLFSGDIIKSIKFEGEDNSHEIVRKYQVSDILLLANCPIDENKTKVTFEVVRNGETQSIEVEFAKEDFVLVK